MRTRKVVEIVTGSLAALIALGLLLAGGGLLALHGIARDSSGYYNSPTIRLNTPTAGLTSDNIDLGSVQEAGWGPFDRLGTARVTAESALGRDVFVGIARQSDVDRYLAGTTHDRVTSVHLDPTRPSYRRIDVGSSKPPAPPASQPFWAASANGAGRQTVRWPVEHGSWAVVVMNADASPGISVDARAGLKTGILLPVGIGVLAVGLLFGALATALLVAGLRPGPTADAPGAASAPSGGQSSRVPLEKTVLPPAPSYPLRLEGRLDEPLNRGLWLVKWFLAIPHLIALAFLWLAFLVLTIVAGIVILFTGRYPRSIFDFNVGVLRWTWRVTFYSVTLGTDRYPPFGLSSDPAYPADLSVDYPDRLSRPLVLLKWWLLALPQLVLLSIFGGGLAWWTWEGNRAYSGPGLIGLLALVAGVILLFTRRYPQSVYDFVLGLQRWTYRVVAYVALMRDEYPPFRLDQGGGDPGGPASRPLPISAQVASPADERTTRGSPSHDVE